MEDIDDAAVLAAIEKQVNFPWHGVVEVPDQAAVGILCPFARATSCLRLQNDLFQRKPRFTLRQEMVAEMFWVYWNQFDYVLQKFDELSGKIQKRGDDWRSSVDATIELPFWIDLFYFYALPFADSINRCIGILLSDAHGSFPREAKTLFNAGATDFSRWKLRCDPEALKNAVANHQAWFQLLRDGERKSFRNSRMHRLNRIQVHQVLARSEDESANEMMIQAILVGMDADNSKQDGWEVAKGIAEGFCSFLSAIPKEAWAEPRFKQQDLILFHGCEPPTFLPRIAI